jgi:hypothetical protein
MKNKIRQVNILPEIGAAICGDIQAIVDAHGFNYAVNYALARLYKLETPATHAEIVAEAQRRRWKAAKQAGASAEVEAEKKRAEAKKLKAARDARYRANKKLAKAA